MDMVRRRRWHRKMICEKKGADCYFAMKFEVLTCLCAEHCVKHLTSVSYNILYTGIYLPPFYFRPVRPSFQQANLRLVEMK